MVRAFLVLSLAVTFYFALEAKAELECTTVFKGCNIVGQQCECGKQTACENPWMFASSKLCRHAMFGDACKNHVCHNQGVCVQQKEGAICKCAGTGFYGDHCEQVCPATEEMKRMDALPTACVIP
ncbi:cell death abnormality protein 1 [Strongylocentrotus purpuratus]|uniref:EGF-like domain-containing protein n=1 Tax=Strongylocentrotus purpuratus TaxID=7668 RepID=A0A7M7G3C5_STRPU|nr:cell death abnormality protein 1 [Strongylocentrotus purpuratus]|eukprot:XP_001176229.1 PREDICTED: zinc metalloproteinase-disintegrin agkistin isoform X2 [Strongylocentrotus purpuratus]